MSASWVDSVLRDGTTVGSYMAYLLVVEGESSVVARFRIRHLLFFPYTTFDHSSFALASSSCEVTASVQTSR